MDQANNNSFAPTTSKTAGDLFIVDNSEVNWKGLKRLEDLKDYPKENKGRPRSRSSRSDNIASTLNTT